MERKYLVAYDIKDPRRLVRVAKTMENYGIRVQKSVFEVLLTPLKIRTLKNELRKEIDPEIDGIKFIPVCLICDQRVNLIGFGLETDLYKDVIVV